MAPYFRAPKFFFPAQMCLSHRNTWTPSVWVLAPLGARVFEESLWLMTRLPTLYKFRAAKFAFLSKIHCPLCNPWVPHAPFSLWAPAFGQHEVIVHSGTRDAYGKEETQSWPAWHEPKRWRKPPVLPPLMAYLDEPTTFTSHLVLPRPMMVLG